MATAPIQPLAWEPPYAAGVAQEIAKKKKKRKKERKKENTVSDWNKSKIVMLNEKKYTLFSMPTQDHGS